ncbi:11083_t:CDS:2 [Dentiscutata erythropus]|uniref:11083_t:CDS:1 n=1 Tax=Dentiscutata erythropus TaxID=1348616 RepID=A0A9N9F1A1_9GLOM|nr:11083_t:CDS:2 [Dentiscutata erythropus]
MFRIHEDHADLFKVWIYGAFECLNNDNFSSTLISIGLNSVDENVASSDNKLDDEIRLKKCSTWQLIIIRMKITMKHL